MIITTEFSDALNKAGTDDSVTIVALTGDGDYYSSGNDISGFLNVSDPQESLIKAHRILREMILSYCRFPKLLISVVNGPCIGIAATTAILCDIIYAVDSVNLESFFFGKTLEHIIFEIYL